MKKTLIAFTAVIMLAACHRKAAPEVNTGGTSSSKETGKTETKTNTATAPVSGTPSLDNKNQNSDIKPPMSLDLGKAVFVNRCGKCHALKQPNNYTKGQWENILKAMAPKAKLTAEETDQVSAYLLANSK